MLSTNILFYFLVQYLLPIYALLEKCLSDKNISTSSRAILILAGFLLWGHPISSSFFRDWMY